MYEEIGFDVAPLIVESDYVETIHQQTQQRTKLFIIANVSEEARSVAVPRALLAHSDGLADGVCAADAPGDWGNRLALGCRPPRVRASPCAAVLHPPRLTHAAGVRRAGSSTS